MVERHNRERNRLPRVGPPPHNAVQLPTLLVNDEGAVRSMCIAAAVARCRHPSCSKPEATKLALRYGFLCAEADTVMVAILRHPTAPGICCLLWHRDAFVRSIVKTTMCTCPAHHSVQICFQKFPSMQKAF